MKELDNLVELTELFELLGYQDERSVIKWCGRNNIPIVKLGLKKYISSHLLTQIVDNQLVIFVKDNKITNKSSEAENEKTQEKPVRVQKGAFNPDNEIILKYLAKYESAKINTSKKTAP